jgi:signal transduction histidine kinase
MSAMGIDRKRMLFIRGLGMGTPGNDDIKQQIIIKFSPVAVVFFCVFIPVDFFISKDYLSGWFLSGTFVFFILSMLVYVKTKNVKHISNMLATLGIPVLIPWLITGGPFGNGFWWSVVYVVWAFCVANQKSAIFWLSLHIVLSAVVAVFSHIGIVKIAYSIPQLLNVLFAFVVTFTLVFLFNRVLLYYLRLAHERAELVEINKKLAAANKELEQFAYIASHDLQEPLRNITNFVGLLEKKLAAETDADTDYTLSVIVKSAERMKILIRELLNFSRIGGNKTAAKISCEKVLQEVLTDMASVIAANQAVIIADTLPVISGNETEIKQLFQNLLSNAIKFRKVSATPQIRITCESLDNNWKFSIGDNGIGIEKDHSRKVFLIFQRLHSDSEYPGTGIGLATCKKIVERAGGKIWIKSKTGVGTTFFFTIPQ